MSEVNWDENARAAAMEFACYIGKAKDCKKYFEHIAPKKIKTVEDAVRVHGGKWPFSYGIENMGYSPKHNHYFSFGNGYKFIHGEYRVCTREQFEACAAKKGEKWTHVYSEHEPCRVLIETPDRFGIIVIDTASNGYLTCAPDELNPIKPTITKAQSDAVKAAFGWLGKNMEECNEYLDKFEVKGE